VAQIDKPVKDFKLRDITSEKGSTVSLSQYKGKKAVVAVFLSYNCGTTWRYEKRLGKLMADYGKKDVVFLGHPQQHQRDRRRRQEVRGSAQLRRAGPGRQEQQLRRVRRGAGHPDRSGDRQAGRPALPRSLRRDPDEASAKQPFVANALAALTSNKPGDGENVARLRVRHRPPADWFSPLTPSFPSEGGRRERRRPPSFVRRRGARGGGL
jgi:hypothetical protein